MHYHDAWAVVGAGDGCTRTVDGGAGPDGPGGGEIERSIGQPGHRRRIDYVFVGSRLAHPHG